MRTLRVRPPAVAGLFYPADPGDLRAAVDVAIAEAARVRAPAGQPAKAIVVPHAGYAYSAPVAASAYAQLLPLRGSIERAVLLGPAHRAPLMAVAASSADAFETPLGLVPVDCAARDDLIAAGLVIVADQAHAAEHSLEVQLPFVQSVLGDVEVLPLLVGHASADAVAAVLDHAWGGPETLVIVSTDLSHYRGHHAAQRRDRRTADAVLAKRPDAVGPDDACGVFPLRGLLATARRRRLDVELMDLRTSADTVGDPNRAVGYGAFVLREQAA